ncbi:MAG: Gfo/Idh/MocA family oxidoreductase [Candidatus Brockarchaeota archaeon]|nr:Gfo/Idh/MocA family oxidoreductase [Candidatus Brockarchaeota archaeon]
MPVRIGVSGCGSVSQRGILPHLSQEDVKEKVELAAVCDVVAERAEACKRKFGAGEFYDDYERMLSEAGLDAVTVATPIQLHYDQVLKAVRAGISVHVNKPMALTRREADDIIGERDRKGVKLVASPGIAFASDVRKAVQILKEGTIGKIYWARTGATSEGHETEEFRKTGDVLTGVDASWYYRKGGGPLYDMGVYALHLLTGVLGPAKRVAAMSGVGLKSRMVLGREVAVEMDDNTVMLLDFGDATFAMLHSSFCSGDGEPFSRLHVAGSDGALELRHDGIVVWGSRIEGGRTTLAVQKRLPYVSGVHAGIPEAHIYSDIMHLVDCMLNDKTPLVSGEHARHVVEVIEKAYLAAETGRTQEIETDF